MKKLILLLQSSFYQSFALLANAKKPSVDGSKNEDKTGNSTENIKLIRPK